MTQEILQEGDLAPDFELLDSQGEKVHLSQFLGKKNVVVFFYPKDMTPGCTREACDFSEQVESFVNQQTVVLGISFDSVASHQKFIDKHDLKITLLSDSAKRVADLYGVHQEKNMYGKKVMGIVRSTFVIDRDGKIQKIFPKVKVEGHVDAVLASLEEVIT